MATQSFILRFITTSSREVCRLADIQHIFNQLKWKPKRFFCYSLEFCKGQCKVSYRRVIFPWQVFLTTLLARAYDEKVHLDKFVARYNFTSLYLFHNLSLTKASMTSFSINKLVKERFLKEKLLAYRPTGQPFHNKTLKYICIFDDKNTFKAR